VTADGIFFDTNSGRLRREYESTRGAPRRRASERPGPWRLTPRHEAPLRGLRPVGILGAAGRSCGRAPPTPRPACPA
jgi:hypothetical protein